MTTYDGHLQADCQGIYLDCKNYYDVGVQLATALAVVYLFTRIINHCRNLCNDLENDVHSEYQKSIRRKMRVNFIQITYLVSLLLSTIYSIVLFFFYRYRFESLQQHPIFAEIYKISEVNFITWLNVLNTTVGFLYWKAIRGFYVLSEKPTPIFLHSRIKYAFFLVYGYNLAVLMVAIFLPIIGLKFCLNIMTLVATIISIIACVGCRYAYRKIILSQVELSRRAVRKEVISSCLLVFSSAARIGVYLTQIIADNEWNDIGRKFNDRCIDQWPIAAAILLVIQVVINLLPAAIYNYLFKSEATGNIKKGLLDD